MLCLCRPPEQAQPLGNVCLSVCWCGGEELGSVRCGLLHPKALRGLFQATLARPRGAIASAIVFAGKTRSRQKKLIGNQLGSVAAPSPQVLCVPHLSVVISDRVLSRTWGWWL